MGRYPRGHKFIFVSSIRGASNRWFTSKKINKGDHNAKSLCEKLVNIGKNLL